jgi:hypothetical protein
MLEQRAGMQAKIVAEPRKSSNAGPYVNGDTSNRVRVSAAVDIIHGGHWSPKGRPKWTTGCLSNRREFKPKLQLTHENPAMRDHMSTGTPPTEIKFS